MKCTQGDDDSCTSLSVATDTASWSEAIKLKQWVIFLNKAMNWIVFGITVSAIVLVLIYFEGLFNAAGTLIILLALAVACEISVLVCTSSLSNALKQTGLAAKNRAVQYYLSREFYVEAAETLSQADALRDANLIHKEHRIVSSTQF